MSIDGFETYNSASTRTFFADAATGDIEIIGELSSGTAGRRLVVNPTGSTQPEIRFYPTTGTNYSVLSAWDNTSTPASAAAIQLKTSVDANSVFSAVAMDETTATFGRYKLAVDDTYYATGGFVDAVDAEIRVGHFSGFGGEYGGLLIADADFAEVGYYGAGNVTTWFFGDDGISRHYGKFPDFQVPLSNTGLFTGSTSLTGGTVVNIDFGPTMDSQLLPLYTIRDDIVHSSCASGSDSDGFQITLSPAGNGSWALYFWAFRI
jgi:hypothetical protein